MSWILAIARLIILLGWTLLCGLAALCVGSGGWGGIKRVTGVTGVWCRGFLKVMGVRLRVHGNADFFGRLIISNHTSYLDIMLHGAFAGVRFASKQEVKSYPLVGWLLAAGRPIWIDRRNRAASQRVLEEFKASLDHGINLIVYPEGTTSDGLHGISPFKSTAFEAACEKERGVQPIITRTRLTDNGFNAAWYGNMTLLPHLQKLLACRRIASDIYVLPFQLPLAGEDRKAMAGRIHDYMSRALEIIDRGDGREIAELLAGR